MNLSEEQLEEIKAILSAEIPKAKGERAEQEESWKKWRRMTEGVPASTSKSYPFANASNVSVPLTGTIAQVMYGALKAAFDPRKPVGMASALNKDSSEERLIAEAITDYFSIIAEDPQELKKALFDKDFIYEAGRLGLAFAKVPYSRRVNKVSFNDKMSGTPGSYNVTTHDGPEWVFYQPEDVVWPQQYQNLQQAPWVAVKFSLSPQELKAASVPDEAGVFLYENVDLVMGQTRNTEEGSDEETRERIGITISDSNIYDLWEVYYRYDADGDDIAEDLILTYHLESNTILRDEFNSLGERPLVYANYMHRPKYIQGMGVGWMSQSMQEEVDTLHNMRIDNMHIAGVRMFAVKKNAGVRPDEKLYPGKILFLNDPRDIQPLQAGEVYPSSERTESLGIMYAQKFTGMSDTMGGFPDSVMRTSDTVGGQVLRLKQSSGMFASIIENFEDAYSQLWQLTFKQLVMHKDEVMEKEKRIQRMSPEKLAALEKGLDMAPEDIPKKLRFSIGVTDVEQSFEVQRQNAMTMVQITSMYYEKAMQVAMMVENPQLPQTVKDVAISGLVVASKLMQQVMKLFEFEDLTKNLPDMRKLEYLQAASKQMLGAFSGGMQPPQSLLGQQGGMQPQQQLGPPAGASPASALSPSSPEQTPGGPVDTNSEGGF